MSKYRNRYCGKITESDVDKDITVAGWIANIRDHGGVIFVDVRDYTINSKKKIPIFTSFLFFISNIFYSTNNLKI